jgi:hypothetical protein
MIQYKLIMNYKLTTECELEKIKCIIFLQRIVFK